nr:unnamed protein product [Callosobruchus analis]
MLSQKYSMALQGVKNKVKILRPYFSKERQKVTEKKSCERAEDKYDSPWFTYTSILFISDSITERATEDSLVLITILHYSVQKRQRTTESGLEPPKTT